MSNQTTKKLMKLAVQRDVDERWRNRKDKEDRITANTIEPLPSDVTRPSKKLSEEVFCLKSRHHGSAARTVAGSTGSGGSTVNFAAGVVQNTFTASRIELKGWGCWRNIRATGIALDVAKQLISETKTRIKPDDMNMFDRT